MGLRTCLLAFVLCTCGYELAAQPTAASVDKQIEELRMARAQVKLKRDLASRSADRLLTEDWLGYQRELAKEERLDKELEEIDEKIKILEDERRKLPYT